MCFLTSERRSHNFNRLDYHELQEQRNYNTDNRSAREQFLQVHGRSGGSNKDNVDDDNPFRHRNKFASSHSRDYRSNQRYVDRGFELYNSSSFNNHHSRTYNNFHDRNLKVSSHRYSYSKHSHAFKHSSSDSSSRPSKTYYYSSRTNSARREFSSSKQRAPYDLLRNNDKIRRDRGSGRSHHHKHGGSEGDSSTDDKESKERSCSPTISNDSVVQSEECNEELRKNVDTDEQMVTGETNPVETAVEDAVHSLSDQLSPISDVVNSDESLLDKYKIPNKIPTVLIQDLSNIIDSFYPDQILFDVRLYPQFSRYQRKIPKHGYGIRTSRKKCITKHNKAGKILSTSDSNNLTTINNDNEKKVVDFGITSQGVVVSTTESSPVKCSEMKLTSPTCISNINSCNGTSKVDDNLNNAAQKIHKRKLEAILESLDMKGKDSLYRQESIDSTANRSHDETDNGYDSVESEVFSFPLTGKRLRRVSEHSSSPWTVPKKPENSSNSFTNVISSCMSPRRESEHTISTSPTTRGGFTGNGKSPVLPINFATPLSPKDSKTGGVLPHNNKEDTSSKDQHFMAPLSPKDSRRFVKLASNGKEDASKDKQTQQAMRSSPVQHNSKAAFRSTFKPITTQSAPSW